MFLILGGATAFAASTKIGSSQLKANSVKTGKIVKEAVTEGKLKNGAVTAGKLGPAAVTSEKIADNAVTTAKIANDAVTGEKVKESTLGEVPSANNSNNLGGTPAAGYVKGPLEGVHIIGDSGEPAFQNNCKNLGFNFQPAGFYKDPFGIVHLVGDIEGCTGQLVFTLPEGFRPTSNQRFTVHATDTTVGTIRVDPDGTVNTFSDTKPIINGLTFRTN